MTYLEFHYVFTFPAVLVLGVYAMATGKLAGKRKVSLLLLASAAFVYTTGWDNFLVWKEIWWYGPDRVIATIGYVPVEEYAFFLLQPFITGLFYYSWPGYAVPDSTTYYFRSVALHLTFSAIVILSIVMLFFPETLYLGLILVWAVPVLWFQAVAIGSAIVERFMHLLMCALLPTIFLWFADGYAIRNGIWTISDRYTTGWHLFGLPVEEATFFLITSTMVVFGLLGADLFWKLRGGKHG